MNIYIKYKEDYNFYTQIKSKSDKVYYKHNLSKYLNIDKSDANYILHEEMAKSMLYNIILNICNQVIYDYIHIFSKDELYFMADFKLDNIYMDILNDMREDIYIMKNEKN